MVAAMSRERSLPQTGLESAIVDKTKLYLQQRLEKLAPDAVLTHAWDRFYEIHTRVLRGMAAKFRLDFHESEDLVQEVWTRVILHFRDFNCNEHGSGLRGWLYTLIRNEAISLIRRKARRPVRLTSGPEIQGIADSKRSAVEPWQACWDRELLKTLMAQLAQKVDPINHRLVILRWIEGRSISEVALTLNLTEKQVVYRQHRLFRKLRATVALYRGEPLGASDTSPLT